MDSNYPRFAGREHTASQKENVDPNKSLKIVDSDEVDRLNSDILRLNQEIHQNRKKLLQEEEERRSQFQSLDNSLIDRSGFYTVQEENYDQRNASRVENRQSFNPAHNESEFSGNKHSILYENEIISSEQQTVPIYQLQKKQDESESQSDRSRVNQQTEHSTRIIHDISAERSSPEKSHNPSGMLPSPIAEPQSHSQRLPLWTNNPSMVSALNEPRTLLSSESQVSISTSRDKLVQPKQENPENYDTDFSISGSYDQFKDLKFTRNPGSNQATILEGIKQIRVSSQSIRGDLNVITMHYNQVNNQQESPTHQRKQSELVSQAYGDYSANIDTPQANTPIINSSKYSKLEHSPYNEDLEEVPSPTRQIRF